MRWGNREKRILCESLWMKENGHQVIIITPEDTPLFKKAKQNRLRVYPISFKPLAGIGEYGRLKQIFAGEHPFVVNAHGRRDAKLSLKAAQITDVPCRIIFRHNGKRVKRTRFNKKMYNTLCHYVFTTSQDSTTYLKQTFSLSDMHIFSIPDGIAMPDAAPDNTAKNTARQKLANTLGLAKETRFIGVFGKIDSQSMRQVCKTAEQLNRHFPTHHLLIPAVPKNQDSIDGKTSPRVHMLPLTEKNSPSFYLSLDCCIYFSHPKNFYQGVPLEITGAMAFLCPVIGPDTPGIRDILIEDKTGKIFHPKQSESVLEIIRWILNTPHTVQTLTHAARALVEKQYTMDAMGRTILRIYRLHQVKMNRQFQTNAYEINPV